MPVDSYSQSLSTISSRALVAFQDKHSAREHALRISREIINLSSNAIRAVHRKEYDSAREIIATAGERIRESNPILQSNPDIYHSGYLADARKEFSEANIILAIISGKQLPQPEEVGVDIGSYLKGMGDAVGEMRRFILDSLRKNDWAHCDKIMDLMDEVYGLLISIDFPEGVTGGLRRTTDMVRSTLERTRGDFTMAKRQRELEQQLTYWQNHLYKDTTEIQDNL